jgi:hypothetical protein
VNNKNNWQAGTPEIQNDQKQERPEKPRKNCRNTDIRPAPIGDADRSHNMQIKQ